MLLIQIFLLFFSNFIVFKATQQVCIKFVKPQTIIQQFLINFSFLYIIVVKNGICQPLLHTLIKFIKPLSKNNKFLEISILIESYLQTILDFNLPRINFKDTVFGEILLSFYILFNIGIILIIINKILIFNIFLKLLWPEAHLSIMLNFLFLLCLLAILIYFLIIIYKYITNLK